MDDKVEQERVEGWAGQGSYIMYMQCQCRFSVPPHRDYFHASQEVVQRASDHTRSSMAKGPASLQECSRSKQSRPWSSSQWRGLGKYEKNGYHVCYRWIGGGASCVSGGGYVASMASMVPVSVPSNTTNACLLP
jgi:hypothetical protein